MKIREINHKPLFVIEFSGSVDFTELDDTYEGIFNLKELTALGDHISAALQDHNPPSHHVDKVSDDVDTDPPDQYNWNGLEEGREYNVFENEDGHDCNTTVDGG